MKPFTIAEVLLYDPTRTSPKRKPIEIDIQEAKIVAYHPHTVELEQKCNSVGMAEGVYSFCQAMRGAEGEGKGEGGGKGEWKGEAGGWQTILMDRCTLILSEVEENVWVFVKLEHEEESKYCRMGDPEENSILDSSFSDQICRQFMQHFYRCFYTFYGPIRGWIFREKLAELQKIITLFVGRYE
jgi:hypothetical protein